MEFFFNYGFYPLQISKLLTSFEFTNFNYIIKKNPYITTIYHINKYFYRYTTNMIQYKPTYGKTDISYFSMRNKLYFFAISILVYKL
jgi:hypothetical protein